jgi:hypothetical protein
MSLALTAKFRCFGERVRFAQLLGDEPDIRFNSPGTSRANNHASHPPKTGSGITSG